MIYVFNLSNTIKKNIFHSENLEPGEIYAAKSYNIFTIGIRSFYYIMHENIFLGRICLFEKKYPMAIINLETSLFLKM